MKRFLLLSALLLTATPTQSAPAQPAPVWQESWASAQQIPEPNNALDPAALSDASLRQIVHLSAGGGALRVRLSNAFGTAPLTLDAVHVARALSPAGAAIDPATDHVVTFDGQSSVTIPAGADYLSDPIPWRVAPFSDLAVSMHFATAPQQQTSHPGSRATSWLLRGQHSADAVWTGARSFEHWFNLSGVEVLTQARAGGVVALGDSITDGHGATTNGNDRWPDALARRGAAQGLAVVNVGIGGNRLLRDGLGPNALARFDRDVLAQSGACTVILLEGINDLGTFARDPAQRAALTSQDHQKLVAQIIGAYQQIIARGHAHGLRMVGATILPFGGNDYYHPDAALEADRLAINGWIRAKGHFDAMVDFDAVTRDPQRPDRMRPAFDSGDHLHPSPAGYKAMAGAIPLAGLTSCKAR